MEARQLAFPDLVWSHFSRPRFGDFDGRVAAAASAGMAGIGLYVFEYARLRDEEGRSPADIRARARPARRRARRRRGDPGLVGHARRAARRVAADRDSWPGRWRTSSAFATCRRSARTTARSSRPQTASATCAIVPPNTACSSASSRCRTPTSQRPPMRRRSSPPPGRPNGGYCVDIWHHTRGANDLEEITSLEPERVFAIQMNDGALTPALDDYKIDCLANRRAARAGRVRLRRIHPDARRHGCRRRRSRSRCVRPTLWDAARRRRCQGRRRRDA